MNDEKILFIGNIGRLAVAFIFALISTSTGTQSDLMKNGKVES